MLGIGDYENLRQKVQALKAQQRQKGADGANTDTALRPAVCTSTSENAVNDLDLVKSLQAQVASLQQSQRESFQRLARARAETEKERKSCKARINKVVADAETRVQAAESAIRQLQEQHTNQLKAVMDQHAKERGSWEAKQQQRERDVADEFEAKLKSSRAQSLERFKEVVASEQEWRERHEAVARVQEALAKERQVLTQELERLRGRLEQSESDRLAQIEASKDAQDRAHDALQAAKDEARQLVSKLHNLELANVEDRKLLIESHTTQLQAYKNQKREGIAQLEVRLARALTVKDTAIKDLQTKLARALGDIDITSTILERGREELLAEATAELPLAAWDASRDSRAC